MGKLRDINFYDEVIPWQTPLFPQSQDRGSHENFPPFSRSEADFRACLERGKMRGQLGFDIEYDPDRGYRPTIIGIATDDLAVGLPWDDTLARMVVESGVLLIAHSGISADRPCVEKRLGIKTPVTQWYDTMLVWFLMNQDLSATDIKEEDEDDGAALGLMNLWTMASVLLDIPQYKECRGSDCFGPCPRHKPFEYCACDAWVHLQCKQQLEVQRKYWRVPDELVADLHRRQEICYLREQEGIRIDRDLANQLDQEKAASREALFQEDAPFNPRSHDQISKYFKDLKYPLKTTDKESVLRSLTQHLRAAKIDFDMDEKRGLLQVGASEEPRLTPQLSWLYRLHQYKTEGKGFGSWIDPKYFRRDGLIHPRWSVCAASFGRLGSSKPNCQNWPRVGSGSQIRRCVVPLLPGYKLFKADYRSLELMKCLHSAGVTLKPEFLAPFGGDVFKWMVSTEKYGAYSQMAAERALSPRDVAKSVAHATDYGEGLVPLSPFELPSRKREIDSGALKVYKDWTWRGKILCCTGVNLARRLFGNESWGARAKALAVRDAYLEQIPQLLPWQKAVSASIEDKPCTRSALGRMLRLRGRDDDLKASLAFVGQGESADYVQNRMEQYFYNLGFVFYLFVHDELVYNVPEDWSASRCQEFSRVMEEEWDRLGFRCAVQAKTGPNWLDMQPI